MSGYDHDHNRDVQVEGQRAVAVEDHAATARRITLDQLPKLGKPPSYIPGPTPPPGSVNLPFVVPGPSHTQSPSKPSAGAVTHQLGEEYTEQDISSELYREVWTSMGCMRIDYPITLITRKNGKTHRVIDQMGVVHCYAAPETGQSFLKWVPKVGAAAVSF